MDLLAQARDFYTAYGEAKSAFAIYELTYAAEHYEAAKIAFAVAKQKNAEANEIATRNNEARNESGVDCVAG